MADALAEKSNEKSDEQKKSEDEIAKDTAATELLKEIDDAEKVDAEKESEGDKDKEATEKKKDEDEDGETSDDEDKSDDPGSQPDKTAPKGKRGFKRRQAKLVAQREEAKAEKDKFAQKLVDSAEENKLLQMKVDQLEGRDKPLKEPNVDDFDGGDVDPDFIKAKSEYDDAKVERMVNRKVLEATKLGGEKVSKEQQARALEDKQKKHWEDADALEVKDYDEKEESLIDIIGAEMVTNIIDFFPGESHKLVYYLGTNKKEAEDVAELLENRATLVKGVAKLGRILERQNIKDPNTSINPDPDVETEGSSPSPQESLQLRLEKMREDVANTGRSDGMKRILAFKKKAKERGIILR